MKLNIKATNFKLTPDIYDYLVEKIGALDRFIEGADSVIQAWAEIGVASRHHKSGDVYRAEVSVNLPGKNILVEGQAKDIRLAINEVREKLERELKEYKGKQAAKQKRGSRAVKKFLKLSPLARLWRKGRIREEGM